MPITSHVLIIGGGLAGPCLALTLARHKIRSTIYEIRSSLPTTGGSISLGPNALRILDKYAGVLPQLEAVGFSYRRFGAYTDGGEQLGEINVGEEGEGGYPALRVMRETLHKVLLDAAEKEGVKVEWGKRVKRVEESEKQVTAYFEDGGEAHGDILIGSDGIHSQVRQLILGDAAPKPIYSGLCVINGFLPATAAIAPSSSFHFPAFMFTARGIFMTIPIDKEGKTLAWGMVQPVEKERTRAEWAEFERSGEAIKVAKKDYEEVQAEPVRSLLDNVDDSKARVWPTYSIPTLPTWHSERMCLIGDAAHALPPNGQGSLVAFEDAATLAHLLNLALEEPEMSLKQVFERFEEVRRPRLERLVQEGKTGDKMKAKSGPWVWYLKKYMFRLFFWFTGGVLQHTEEGRFNIDDLKLK